MISERECVFQLTGASIKCPKLSPLYIPEDRAVRKRSKRKEEKEEEISPLKPRAFSVQRLRSIPKANDATEIQKETFSGNKMSCGVECLRCCC